MRISELVDHDVAILGFGREGRSALEALRRAGHRREVHVITDRPTDLPEGTRGHVGTVPRADVYVRSPGFAPHHPLRRSIDATGALQTTATVLFLSELRHHGLTVVGVTGSKGKSTTSTMAYRTIARDRAAVLVGNIGAPALDELDRILRERPVTIMEMSSYQCSDLPEGTAPSIAAILELFPEHLDWHGSLGAYYGAKARIGLAQRDGDALRFDPTAADALGEAARRAGARMLHDPEDLHFEGGVFRRGRECLFDDAPMKLPGEHNRRNAVAALALVEALGPARDRPWHEHLAAVLAELSCLPFRLEDEGMHAGRRFINDSIATAPEALAAALRAFPEAKTLIAGGFDRGYDPMTAVRAIAKSALRTVILLPSTGTAIARALRAEGVDVVIVEVGDLEQAVDHAFVLTRAGETVLFSPGAPSYDRYGSFEERGRHLRSLIRSRG